MTDLHQTNPITSERDADVVCRVYGDLMDAWNDASGEAFADVFAVDGDLVGFDGTHFRGRDEIAPFHQELFDTWVKGSRLIGIVRSVRFLAPDIAMMHAVGATVMAGETELDPERNSIQTMTVARHDGRWEIEAFQNTRAVYLGRPDLLDQLTAELQTLA